ncbi:ATP-binding cassette domain-containing protein [Paenibacillus thailandensis]|uniref:ATP-binding cassette domain-containing protein n=1 Tax=Paenibacillus thailandensis TaxID=393250 RepID=A0ABW5QSP9_9BACL
MDILLKARGIGKLTSRNPDRYLFRDVSAGVGEGRRIVLLGASGQGKSTLLRIFARLDAADAGELELLGRPASQWKPQQWRQQVLYVAQQPVMLTGTVGDNLRTASILHGRPFDEPLAEQLMDELGLGGIAWDKTADELSGGEKQRVALVRSLLLKPKLLLLDETTASLDPASKAAAERLLLEWSRREGSAQLWITHDLSQAREVGEEVWFLEGGRLLEKTSAERFFDKPATGEARRFVQAAADARQGV